VDRRPRPARLRGSVLVAVLWCFVLLGAATISILHTTTLELRLVKNHADLVQARYLALAGIERARAVIVREERRIETDGTCFDPTILDDPQDFREVPLGRGRFSVFRPARRGEPARGLVYGLTDLGARLDVNSASLDELKLLPSMTEDAAAAIVDWRDGDDDLTPLGAERDFYASQAVPYRIRNAPIETIREMLMIRGVTPDLLLEEDEGGNGLLDPNEDDGARTSPPDNSDGYLDAGWSDLLTLESSVLNVNGWGAQRLDVKGATEEDFAALDGVSTDLAHAIVAYRGKKAFETIANLLDVVSVREGNQPGNRPGNQGNPPNAVPAGQPPPTAGGPGRQPGPPPGNAAPPPANQGNPGNPNNEPEFGTDKLIGMALFKRFADSTTVDPALEVKSLVNINTAGSIVLACLPGMTEETAEAAVAWRESRGYFSSIAELLDVPGMTVEAFKKSCPRVTVRAGTFLITAEGTIPSTGVRKRMQAVVRSGDSEVLTLQFREDS
jgi:DNA uptake protein ComE-like DNA-binding protein